MSIVLNKFLTAGVGEEMPVYLQNKVRTSNMVAIALMVIALSYWLISALINPELNFIPIIGVVVVATACLLNFNGSINFSRFLLATAPTALAISYQAYLVKAGDEAIVGTMLLSLSFSTVSLILFDLREGKVVFLPVAFCFLLMVSFPYLRDVLEMPLDDAPYREGFIYHLTIVLSVLLNLVNVLVLAYLSLDAERRSEKLLKEAASQQQLAQQKEKELQENLTALQKAQEEEHKRAWASEGFTRFGAELRHYTDEQKMYDTVLAGIIKYVGANQGGLYLAQGEGKEVQLVLQSSYAYDRKKYREQRFLPGQGLVGQCYLERDYTYLTKVPQQYTYITSGLGDATPSALLLIPLKTEEDVMGILEIASFNPFEKHVIEFLMELGEEIAATVHISRTNGLTRSLLEQARQQTEQMQAQEEEMRQNMEELAATQEEMQRKEKEYIRQIRELKEELMHERATERATA